MMEANALRITIAQANRFLQTAKAAMERLESDKFAHFGSQETAACRRASMDLTKALARLRKP